MDQNGRFIFFLMGKGMIDYDWLFRGTLLPDKPIWFEYIWTWSYSSAGRKTQDLSGLRTKTRNIVAISMVNLLRLCTVFCLSVCCLGVGRPCPAAYSIFSCIAKNKGKNFISCKQNVKINQVFVTWGYFSIFIIWICSQFLMGENRENLTFLIRAAIVGVLVSPIRITDCIIIPCTHILGAIP